MEKKNEFDLETKRKAYFALGLFIVSTGVLCAFTYKTPVFKKNNVPTIKQDKDIPVLMVEEKDKPNELKIPEVEKIPDPDPSTSIFNVNLLTKVKPVSGKKSDPKPGITTTSKISTTFNPDPGPAPEMKTVVKYPDQEAEFKGNWQTFLKSNLVYPTSSKERGESGEVYIGFVVERDGTITNIEVLNKNTISETLQNEAIRVIQNSPKWKPGIKNGEKVRTNKNVKVNFYLE